MKYKVTYVHEVEITYEAIVEADSASEAERKMEDFDFESEEEIDHQGIRMKIQDIEKFEEE